MVSGSDTRPTRRKLTSQDGRDVYVIEIHARHFTIRPRGARRNGPAVVQVTPGQIYLRFFNAPRARRVRRPR